MGSLTNVERVVPELFDPMKCKQNEDTHNEILDEWLTKDDESPYASLNAKKIRIVQHSLFQVQRSIQDLANLELKDLFRCSQKLSLKRCVYHRFRFTLLYLG